MARDKRLTSRSPFHNLDKLLKDAGIRLEPHKKEPPLRRPGAATSERPQNLESEDRIFRKAMEDVHRATWRHPPPEAPPAPVSLPSPDSGSEERRLMEAAVEGTPAMTVLDHPEYIEGWIGVAGRLFLPNLRNGLYSIQGQIDLHGLTQQEARERVEQFIVEMSRFRSCCVKIIHGRGINSPNDRAVLKEHLQHWLSTRRMSRHVVAYASAPLKDGGVGAVYVLLRRVGKGSRQQAEGSRQ